MQCAIGIQLQSSKRSHVSGDQILLMLNLMYIKIYKKIIIAFSSWILSGSLVHNCTDLKAKTTFVQIYWKFLNESGKSAF